MTRPTIYIIHYYKLNRLLGDVIRDNNKGKMSTSLSPSLFLLRVPVCPTCSVSREFGRM